jgi:hypothetical protein
MYGLRLFAFALAGVDGFGAAHLGLFRSDYLLHSVGDRHSRSLDSPRPKVPLRLTALMFPHLYMLCDPTNATFSTSASWSTSWSKNISSFVFHTIPTLTLLDRHGIHVIRQTLADRPFPRSNISCGRIIARRPYLRKLHCSMKFVYKSQLLGPTVGRPPKKSL